MVWAKITYDIIAEKKNLLVKIKGKLWSWLKESSGFYHTVNFRSYSLQWWIYTGVVDQKIIHYHSQIIHINTLLPFLSVILIWMSYFPYCICCLQYPLFQSDRLLRRSSNRFLTCYDQDKYWSLICSCWKRNKWTQHWNLV